MTSRFLDIIENVEVFHYMLDGFFKDWPGTYDVLLADTNEYLFNPTGNERFQELCHTIRRVPNGINFCKNCDGRYAKEAAEQNKPLVYMCEAGLLDIAIPIIVNDELIATIFCGQRRSTKIEQEDEGKKLAFSAAQKLGISPQILADLRAKVPVLLDKDIDAITEKLWKMANYLSNLGKDKAELEQQRRSLSFQLHEKTKIDQAISYIDDSTESIDEFWRKVTIALRELSEVVKAEGSAIIMYEQKIGHSISHSIVKAATGIVSNLQEKTYRDGDEDFESIILSTESKIYNLDPLTKPNTFWWDVCHMQPTNCLVNKFASIPLRLDARYKGIIVFLVCDAHDTESGLTMKDELSLLMPVSDRIATAYRNHLLLADHQSQVKLRGEWLDNISHQIMAPVTGIQGHNENLQRWLRQWIEQIKPSMDSETDFEDNTKEFPVTIETSLQRIVQIDHTLEAVISMTHSANRLARNFAWIGGIGGDKKIVSRTKISKMVSLLISLARNVQGLARQRGLRRVHVDDGSVWQLNNRIAVNRGTEVIITGNILDNKGIISITNWGIPIREEDVEKIFLREYRTRPAIARYPVGTGIGLTIARDIVLLHGGKLLTSPSKSIRTPEYIGYETTFQVVLPLTY
jgi:signal transduction histidine kinase/ligand-binding sensor protein